MAREFYKRLKASQKAKKTLAVAFDMQKNMPLPQTNVTETYYSRQLWLYNLTFVVHVPSKKDAQNPSNVYTYSWLESDSGKGSNEICSALSNFLEQIRNRVKVGQY